MAKKGMFIQKDEASAVKGKSHRTYKQFKYAEDLDNKDNTYQFDALQAGQTGTRVPISREYGGVEGTNDTYGTIVQGKTLTGAGDGQGFTILSEFIPHFMKDKEDGMLDTGKNNTEQAIHRLMNENPNDKILPQYPSPIQHPPPQPYPQHHQPQNIAHPSHQVSPYYAQQPPVETVEKESVKVSGTFGTFKGSYEYVVVTEQFVVLVSSQADNMFTPPVAQETFKISCKQGDYTVYFVGVEFELPFIDKTIQVMIRDNA